MNSIHLKLEYEDALSSKKDLLLIEQSLLNSINHLKNFNSLRKKEFAFKTVLKKDMSILENKFQETENILPINELHIIINKPKETIKKIAKQEEHIEPRIHSDIERQLQEIQSKLASLS
jgi:hypothetical protein